MAQITTNTTKSRVERDIPGGKQIENTKETFTDLVVPWLVIRREFDGASGELIKEYPIDRFDVTTKFYERETETITYLLKSLGIQAGDSMAIPGHGSFSALAELLGLQQGLRIAEPGASILPLGTPQKEASNSGVLIAKEDDREKAKEILENEMPRVFVAETRSELEKALKAVRKAEALGLRVKPLIIVPEKLRKAAASQLAPRQESKLLAEQKTPLALPALIARRVTNYHGALIVGMKEPLRARKLQPVGQELQHAQSLSDLRLPQFDKLQNPLRRAAKISGAIPQRNIAKHGLAMSEAHTQAEKLPQANAR
ncbi:MAG: hypothetical protein KDD62_08270, partial [Bdellovibrionales bacterium]|nr:hypothetical protein [Bdellovibrionales bacterium]